MPYLLPLFVLMLRVTGALGLRIRRRILQLRILRVRRGIWRLRLARCGRHDHTRAVAQAVCAVDHHPLTDRHTPELTAAIGPSVGPILTGRTDTLLSALMT